MSRLSIVFWLILVLGTGFTTFKVKYAVQDIEDELARVRKQTVAEQQEIRVLNAEWTYLNQPERLAELNRKFLNLTPVSTKQLQQRIADLPLRPPPPPPIPDPPVAADPPADDAPAPPAPVGSDAAIAATEPGPDSPPAMPGSLDALIAANLGVDQPVPLDATEPNPIAPAAAPVAAEPKTVTPAIRALAALTIAPAAAAESRPVARTRAASRPGSLDALIAQIADRR